MSKKCAFIAMPALEPRKIASMEMVICVGFGSAYVSRDGETVWQEQQEAEWDDLWTVEKAESVASLDPDHDWRIHRIGPLSEFHWQRQGNEWVMYHKGEGFA